MLDITLYRTNFDRNDRLKMQNGPTCIIICTCPMIMYIGIQNIITVKLESIVTCSSSSAVRMANCENGQVVSCYL